MDGRIAFWIFMLVCELLTPAIMVGFGRLWVRRPPNNINYAYGYRTARSMKNRDTWDFAHRCIGRLWLRWGAALLAVSAIFMLILLGREVVTVGNACIVLMAVQLVVMIAPIFVVESKLKKTFDENGIKRQ